MVTQVKSWGNSQGIRIAKELLERLGIRKDDYLNIEIKDNSIVLSKTFKHQTLEERAAQFNEKLGPYEEIDWEGPVGKEIW